MKRKTVSYPLRVPEGLLKLADLRAREERVDRSTALRQLLYAGAEEYVLTLLAQGRISLSKAAELLERSTLAVYELVRAKGLVLGTTPEEWGKESSVR